MFIWDRVHELCLFNASLSADAFCQNGRHMHAILWKFTGFAFIIICVVAIFRASLLCVKYFAYSVNWLLCLRARAQCIQFHFRRDQSARKAHFRSTNLESQLRFNNRQTININTSMPVAFVFYFCKTLQCRIRANVNIITFRTLSIATLSRKEKRGEVIRAYCVCTWTLGKFIPFTETIEWMERMWSLVKIDLMPLHSELCTANSTSGCTVKFRSYKIH